MKNQFLLAVLAVVLTACQPPNGLPVPKKLVIVAPQAWRAYVDPYVDHKSQLGFNVQVMDIETVETTGGLADWGNNLRKALIAARPDYVFLVGDVSVIPTIFTCADTSSWSTFTDEACTYSDLWLQVADDQKTVLFSLGRLMAKDPVEISNYLVKAINYDSQFGKPLGAYLINDRDYDPTDSTVRGYGNLLMSNGIPVHVDTLNTADVPTNNGLTEATYQTVQNAVNDDVSFIMYFGHGSGWGWGYEWNILWPYLTFANAKPVPLVYAMACETAIGAPNPPWYSYYDSTGFYKNFSTWDINTQGAITEQQLGTISSLQFHQPYEVVSDSIARHFTSTLPAGAMVYIGETVVTHAEYHFNDEFYTQLINGYNTGTLAIGDIWLNTIRNMLNEPESDDVHPIFFQFVGDPSTSFPKK